MSDCWVETGPLRIKGRYQKAEGVEFEGDGVALVSMARPVPHRLEWVKWQLVRFVRWATWPLRRHKVIETIEIEIP